MREWWRKGGFRSRRWVLIRSMLGVTSVVLGLATALVTAAVGHCSTFGGTCPSPDGLEGDIYGGLLMGFSGALVVPVLLWKPTMQGLRVAALLQLTAVPVLTYLIGQSLTG
jgi:hypothetical protein